jgi:RNA polymerase sigma-70 factor, ECF subfamily
MGTQREPEDERLEAKFREHGRRIFHFCLARTGSRHDAEDITAETFSRLVRDFDRVAPNAVLPWLLRVATNLCVDRARARQRGRVLGTEVGAVALGFADERSGARLDPPNPHPGPDGAVDRLVVRDALRRLSPLQQQVVYLRSVERRPFAEIGALLGRSEAAVKMQYRRALKRLGAILEVDGDA